MDEKLDTLPTAASMDALGRDIGHLRETMAVHAAGCQQGNLRVRDLQQDIDIIGRSVERMIAVLTLKRRDTNDGNRQG